MKKGLSILTMFMLFCITHAMAQKTLPDQVYGYGYQNAFNLITNGKVSPSQNSTFQNSLILAADNGSTDYYDGLMAGATDAWNSLETGHPVKQVGGTYVIGYSYVSEVDQIWEIDLSDGTSYEIEESDYYYY